MEKVSVTSIGMAGMKEDFIMYTHIIHTYNAAIWDLCESLIVVEQAMVEYDKWVFEKYGTTFISSFNRKWIVICQSIYEYECNEIKGQTTSITSVMPSN